MKKFITIAILISFATLAAAEIAEKDVPLPKPKSEKSKDELIKEYQQQVSDLQSLVRQYKAKSEMLENKLKGKPATPAKTKKAPAKSAAKPKPAESAGLTNELPKKDAAIARKLEMEIGNETGNAVDNSQMMNYWNDGLKDIISGGTKDATPAAGNSKNRKTTLTGGGKMKIKNRTVTVQSDMSRTCSLNCPLPMSNNYDVELLFSRQKGNTQMSFVLPVAGTAAKLVLDKYQGTTYDLRYRKYVAGLEYINGQGVLSNNTRIENFRLNNGKVHSIDIKVRTRGDQVAIVVFLDHQQLANWTGPASALSAYPAQSSAQPKNLSIEFAPNQTVRLSNMRVKNFPKK